MNYILFHSAGCASRRSFLTPVNARIILTSLLLALVAFGFPDTLRAQEIKEGVYMSVEEFDAGTPSGQIPLLIEQRPVPTVRVSGGNLFGIRRHDTIPERYMHREVFAVYQRDSLFINCKKLKLEKWYAYAEKHDDFLFFFAKKPGAEPAVTIGGMAGGMAGAALVSLFNLPDKGPYALNFKTSQLEYITRPLIRKLIDKQNDVELMKHYVQDARDKNFTDDRLLWYYKLTHDEALGVPE